ncbi:hypothetical protein Pcinc_014961 [Petrolisthes cinctipes]|uniref:Uncharacterized protein n=1 Tax=Petrolisthes cinctipes TaxID=88211 RepID=A0AAE1FVW8_PETCI|nr:hypothetical protein Pcinc_014961 [Petrolisthes cinctipes]
MYMVDELKGFNRAAVIGILPRLGASSHALSKAIGVNERLEDMCTPLGVRDRPDREGGGVARYIRDSLDPVICKVGSKQEVLDVDMTVGSGVYRFIVIYCPPHQPIDDDS